MTSARATATFRADFDELSGAIKDKVGSADSSALSGVTYNAANGRKSVTITDGRIEFNGGSKPLNPTGAYTAWLKFRYKQQPSDGDVKTFFAMHPNGFSPTLSWNDSSDTNKFQVDLNNSGSTGVFLDYSRAVQGNEIVCIAWSSSGGVGTLNSALKNKTGDISLSGTVAETGSAPTALGSQIGLDGIDTNFADLEVFEFGVEQGTARSIADLQDTVDEVLAVSELIDSVPTRRYSRSVGTPFGVGAVAVYHGDSSQELPGIGGQKNFGEGSPTSFTFTERRYSQSLQVEGNFEVIATVAGEYQNRKFSTFGRSVYASSDLIYYNNRRFSPFASPIYSSSDIIYYNNRKFTVGENAVFGVASEFVPAEEETQRGLLGRRSRVGRGATRFI